uniref:30S ribosomal protein S9, chloroplastic n=1 Tax=Hanusia phi TaxID=3032 RepID=A0A7S0DZ37_9CRYP|mmetsp:Transcript_11316/g.25693  ORF Transcript_11316/g.25693 Transcript_11316/m.25693 type:complete len:351 (+) Transcript_11316:94-1146(+)
MLLGKEAAGGLARMAMLMRRPPAKLRDLSMAPLRSLCTLSSVPHPGTLRSKVCGMAGQGTHVTLLRGRHGLCAGALRGVVPGQVRSMSNDGASEGKQKDTSNKEETGPTVTVQDDQGKDPNWKFSFRHDGDDEYEPHRQNLEKALQWMKEQAGGRDLNDMELSDLADKAMEKFIPPLPPVEELFAEYYQLEKEKLEAVPKVVKKKVALSEEIARKKIPVLDALGRAYATGKRKTAVARVFVAKGTGKVTINKKSLIDYFSRVTLRDEIFSPIYACASGLEYDVWCTVKGGGKSAQAQAIKLGVARAMQAFDPTFRAVLKAMKLLHQDDRRVERKKPGQPKARKKFQWVKR